MDQYEKYNVEKGRLKKKHIKVTKTLTQQKQELKVALGNDQSEEKLETVKAEKEKESAN